MTTSQYIIVTCQLALHLACYINLCLSSSIKKKPYPVINKSHDEKMHRVEEELCETDSSLHWKSSKSSSLAVAEPYNANMQLNCSSYIISNMSRLVTKLVSYCELSLAAAAGTHCFSEISAELKYRSRDICSYGGFMYAVGKTT